MTGTVARPPSRWRLPLSVVNISARLSWKLEDLAAIGTAPFTAIYPDHVEVQAVAGHRHRFDPWQYPCHPSHRLDAARAPVTETRLLESGAAGRTGAHDHHRLVTHSQNARNAIPAANQAS
jgi:hypothetical protein